MIKELEKKYKRANSLRSNRVERIRFQSRKKFFVYVLYGLFEIREMKGILPDTFGDEYQDQVKSIMELTTQGLYKQANLKAMAIETNLYQAFNSQGSYIRGRGFGFQVSHEYKEKFRTLAMNMKDDKNTELRLKIIFGVLTPKQLCLLSEADLMTSQEKRALAKQKAQYLKDHTLINDDETKIIMKVKHLSIINNLWFDVNRVML